MNKQSRWTNELYQLKNLIKEASITFKNQHGENNRLQGKIYTKQFRKIQRRNIFIYEQNKAKNIEHLYNINNKDDFWKAFNSFKNGDKASRLSALNAESLIDHLVYFILTILMLSIIARNKILLIKLILTK